MVDNLDTSNLSSPASEQNTEKCSERNASSRDAEQTQISGQEIVDIPPNGGYGWVCVACVFWLNAHTWGINSSYGVFLAYYLDSNYFPNATSLEFAFIGGLSISLAMLSSPLATYITRIYGTRTTLLIGVFLETLGLVGASFTREVWQLFLSQGLCFGCGMGFLFVGSVGIVPQWFTTRRSLANAIGVAGSGVGGLIYSLATNAMIENIGIGWAFRILGVLAFVVNFICAILIKDRNKAIGSTQLAFDYLLFKRFEYLLTLGWGIFSMLGYVVLLFSLPNYALSIGLSAQQGSIVAALHNLGQALGRPVVGISSDVAGRINIAGLLTFICGLLCLTLWVFSKSFGVLVFFAIIVGTVSGTFWATIAPVMAEVMGLKELPSALSLNWLVLVIPITVSEPIGLKLRQNSGNIYLHAQIFTGLMYVAASICLWVLRAWKIGVIEEIAAQQGKTPEEVNIISADPSKMAHVASIGSGAIRSSLKKRLFQWKRV